MAPLVLSICKQRAQPQGAGNTPHPLRLLTPLLAGSALHLLCFS